LITFLQVVLDSFEFRFFAASMLVVNKMNQLVLLPASIFQK